MTEWTARQAYEHLQQYMAMEYVHVEVDHHLDPNYLTTGEPLYLTFNQSMEGVNMHGSCAAALLYRYVVALTGPPVSLDDPEWGPADDGEYGIYWNRSSGVAWAVTESTDPFYERCDRCDRLLTDQPNQQLWPWWEIEDEVDDI